MKYTTFGRTGFEVSIIGLGAGGSRFGRAQGRTLAEAENFVRYGLDQGINFVDLGGAIYGPELEVAVGAAIEGCRGRVILSTKANLGPRVWPFENNRTAARLSARAAAELSYVTSSHVIEQRLNASLRRLDTDYIDIFNLHAVTPNQYGAAIDDILQLLLRLKEQGKIRAIGITEATRWDPCHAMLSRAVSDGSFDSIMMRFNMLCPTGTEIATAARRGGSGVIAMVPVGKDLRDLETLQKSLNRSTSREGPLPKNGIAERIQEMLNTHGIESLAEAAIRFCRHESRADVVLTGTGDVRHLEANIASCHADPLPERVTDEIYRLFGGRDLRD